MKNKLPQNWILPNWLRFLVIISLSIGVFFRFVNLDRKVYGGDEIYTSLQISGYTLAEMNKQIPNGNVITLKDLQKYQYPNPEKSVIDTVKSLALEDSQNAPLYYVLNRFWVEIFGNSIAVTRSFSAFISLFAFPCLYWLCQELFESPLIGWVAITLMAISPIHVLYAQEARSYGLWIVIILLSSAILLRAIRQKDKVSWGIYAITVSLGLYSHLFFLLVAIGHGLYIAIMERLRLTKTLMSYLLASFVGFIAFFPWLLIIFFSPPKLQTVDWMNTKSTFVSSAKRWAGIISRTFLDIGASPNDPFEPMNLLISIIVILLIIIIYSMYFIYQKTPKRVWLFTFTLVGVTGLIFLLPDLLLGQRRGTTRYLLPCILGIQISVSYLLTYQAIFLSINNRLQRLWQLLIAILISLGILSCLISSQSEIWWNKAPERNKDNPKMAAIINQSTRPLLISNTDLISVQAFAHLLSPKVKLQLLVSPNLPEIPKGFTDIFLFKSSEQLRSGIEKVYNLKSKLIYSSLEKLENHQ